MIKRKKCIPFVKVPDKEQEVEIKIKFFTLEDNNGEDNQKHANINVDGKVSLARDK